MYALGGLGVFLADWKCKEEIERKLNEGEKRKALGERIQIEKYHNYGGAGNFLQKKPQLMKKLHMAVLGMTAVCALYERRNGENKRQRLGMTLLLAGGANNLLDRCKRGYVVDYIRFRTPWKGLNQMVFNLSDFAVFVGAFLVILSSLKKRK